jgi:Mor family transcriptional regulator
VECVDGSNYPLGAWTGYVRQRRRRGQLAPSKIEKLENIPGWQWGPLRPGPATNANRNNQIMALHVDGKSLSYIADEFQLSRQRVHQIVRKTKKVNA